jgi:hypothetical protein
MNSWLTAVDQMDRAILGGGPSAQPSLLGATVVDYASPTYGTAKAVPCIFDQHFIYQAEGQPGIERTCPAAFLRLADLGAIDPMDSMDKPRLSITEPLTGVVTDYKVHERHLDHAGKVMLFLRPAVP